MMGERPLRMETLHICQNRADEGHWAYNAATMTCEDSLGFRNLPVPCRCGAAASPEKGLAAGIFFRLTCALSHRAVELHSAAARKVVPRQQASSTAVRDSRCQ